MNNNNNFNNNFNNFNNNFQMPNQNFAQFAGLNNGIINVVLRTTAGFSVVINAPKTMTFEELLKDPKVLYVYETGPQIYGLFEGIDRRKFTIICDDGYSPDIESTREKEYTVYPMKTWFEMVMSGNMLAWICACLNKKFIHKEAVKLLMSTNPLQLRKEYDRLKINIMLLIWDFGMQPFITGKSRLHTLLKISFILSSYGVDIS